ncbi:MAG: DUF3179 domain-containing protein [Hyphomicrobiales bacterium]|nr:DUF3179 domain-containing protein [Hyphomicrobiales bacterium]
MIWAGAASYVCLMRTLLPAATIILAVATSVPSSQAQSLADWQREFPETDFSKSAVPFDEIRFDGARRDSIPPIHDPQYVALDELTGVGPLEPVISVVIGEDARAYPLSIMLWHEIVNDVVGDVPVLVSYCPLCNSGVVFDRRLGERTLDFGNTGRLRHFDMVMYDLETESWWQQFSGSAIIGDLVGEAMNLVPSRLESRDQFRQRAPDGLVLVPNDPNLRPYGTTPYIRMESGNLPDTAFLHGLPNDIRPLDYAVIVDTRAWPLKRLMNEKRIEEAGITLTWTPGRNSIHDTRVIAEGRDLGNVVVRDEHGAEVAHDVAFAFAFSAFVPDGSWMIGAE